jgi:hypothetical protein
MLSAHAFAYEVWETNLKETASGEVNVIIFLYFWLLAEMLISF